MPTIAFSLPVAGGKTPVFRAAHRRFAVERRSEFEASRRRLGVTAERGYLQTTPAGDIAVVVFEVSDPARLFAEAATSAAAIDVDFRAYLLDVFSLDLTGGPPAAVSEQVFEWVADGAAPRHG